MTDTAADPSAHAYQVEALSERIFEAALGTVDLLSIYLGDRLGWYRALASAGPLTAPQLAGRTGTAERYAQEWLEQQAVTGLLDVDDAAATAPRRRYAMPPAVAEVLTDEHSLAYSAPMSRMFAASAAALPALLDAYRTGGGVGWEQLGADARESQADGNRPWFEHGLADALRQVPDLHTRLARPGVRIADLGCGAGWSAIALAEAYPDATVDGVDVDAPSVALAVTHGAASPASARLSFRHGDVSDAAQLPTAAYDVVFAFECIHDLPRPVEVLAAARQALVPGGTMVIMDEAVADRFGAPGDEVERLMYGYSLLVCLPDGMAQQPSAATGTVLRPDVLRGYAREAGFADLQVLPIEDFGFWRFYELTP